MSYFVGQGMVKAGDVGGAGTIINPLPVSGIITSASRQEVGSNTGSVLILNWDDPGF